MVELKVDKKDFEIISILSENSRENYSKIAKKIKLSNDSVKNRIEKLIENKIIKSFKLNINYSILGFLEYDIYFKLKNYNEEELNKIINYLNQNKHVTWIGTCFGNYDLRISIIVKENKEVKTFLSEFENNFKKNYLDSFVTFVVEKYKINQKKIISNLFNQTQKEVNLNSKTNNNKNKIDNNSIIKLEKQEKEILQALNENPLFSLIQISKKVKLTPEGIKYNIVQMQKKEIIKSFSTTLNGNKLNKIWAVFLFKLNNENKIEMQKYIQNINNVSAFVEIMGNWDFSVSVFASNVQEIQNILMGFRNKFPNNIKEYEMILIFETYKYPSIPSIVFE